MFTSNYYHSFCLETSSRSSRLVKGNNSLRFRKSWKEYCFDDASSIIIISVFFAQLNHPSLPTCFSSFFTNQRGLKANVCMRVKSTLGPLHTENRTKTEWLSSKNVKYIYNLRSGIFVFTKMYGFECH